MSILFASRNWLNYKDHFKTTFKKNKLDFNEITTNIKTRSTDVEFIIYDPSSQLTDFSNFANTKALSQCLSILRPSVSRPCIIKKALCGESAAPVFLKGTTLQRPINAAGPKASV